MKPPEHWRKNVDHSKDFFPTKTAIPILYENQEA
jgi:hypothetical protein